MLMQQLLQAQIGSLTFGTWVITFLFVASGVTQPLIMTLAKEVGIASPEAQIYMVFYYIGAATIVAWNVQRWPSNKGDVLKTVLIAVFDLSAQATNYTASTMAGPTLFAIIYSSVTVWTAVFSQIFLSRKMNVLQWTGVWIVFGGLCLTGWSSVELGEQVITGCLMVTLGSVMHAMTYILSEAVMKYSTVTIEANCAIQGMTACSCLLLWQVVYTRPRWDELVETPVQNSVYHSWSAVAWILSAFAVASVVHSLCFFHTLYHFPGGATSAGIMKGLQAVLVFVCTSIAYCGRLGGPEMCFTQLKLISLFVVVGGVLVFGKATDDQQKTEMEGYERIENKSGDGDTTDSTRSVEEEEKVVV